jgi:hypothetical protein
MLRQTVLVGRYALEAGDVHVPHDELRGHDARAEHVHPAVVRTEIHVWCGEERRACVGVAAARELQHLGDADVAELPHDAATVNREHQHVRGLDVTVQHRRHAVVQVQQRSHDAAQQVQQVLQGQTATRGQPRVKRAGVGTLHNEPLHVAVLGVHHDAVHLHDARVAE